MQFFRDFLELDWDYRHLLLLETQKDRQVMFAEFFRVVLAQYYESHCRDLLVFVCHLVQCLLTLTGLFLALPTPLQSHGAYISQLQGEPRAWVQKQVLPFIQARQNTTPRDLFLREMNYHSQRKKKKDWRSKA